MNGITFPKRNSSLGERKKGTAICRIFYFVSVTPVGLQQPFSIQSRGVVGSVKMERAKVKLFALESHGFHLLFLRLSGSSISFQDLENGSNHSYLREVWKVTAICNLMKLYKTHCMPVTMLNAFSHWILRAT